MKGEPIKCVCEECNHDWYRFGALNMKGCPNCQSWCFNTAEAEDLKVMLSDANKQLEYLDVIMDSQNSYRDNLRIELSKEKERVIELENLLYISKTETDMAIANVRDRDEEIIRWQDDAECYARDLIDAQNEIRDIERKTPVNRNQTCPKCGADDYDCGSLIDSIGIRESQTCLRNQLTEEKVISKFWRKAQDKNTDENTRLLGLLNEIKAGNPFASDYGLRARWLNGPLSRINEGDGACAEKSTLEFVNDELTKWKEKSWDFIRPKHGETWTKCLCVKGGCSTGWSLGNGTHVIDENRKLSWGTMDQIVCGCLINEGSE